ncbi:MULTISPECIES: TauD/TfdA family dioxygenase [unclassified Streptomyces]|uniref:TauD/TfdA dioxygenase family protein n=1 Tax=unclassified Streptomyces TaxID=2593676 RepID=UPI001F0BEA05|nr:MULTISPECIES: TauD/TfdA family dioxygenase [unclassified Streptomyces]
MAPGRARLVALATLLALCQLVTALQLWSPVLVPSPAAVWNALLETSGTHDGVRGYQGHTLIEHLDISADVTFRECPALGAVLQTREAPPVGGDTLWADMAAAYDNLPEEVKERIEGAWAVHDFIPGFSRFYPPERLAPHQGQFPPVEHPVVRRHPVTGRRTIFVNASSTIRIVGFAQEESARLLRLLFQQAHAPEFQVRYSWRAGDVAFWDNRATRHYAVHDYAPHRRIAERVAIAGDRPH